MFSLRGFRPAVASASILSILILMNVKVWDKDTIGRDDPLGTAKIKLANLKSLGLDSSASEVTRSLP